MTAWQMRYSEHSLDRMLDWGFDAEDVEAAIDSGETIEEYDDDSRLVLGWVGVRPIHVVVAGDNERIRVVVTVYEPDPIRWVPGFRERRKR